MHLDATDVAQEPSTTSHPSAIPGEPCAIVIFGASGDLARRKLIPALYALACRSCLAPSFTILGFARTEMRDEEFRRTNAEALSRTKEEADKQSLVLDSFSRSLHYFAGDYDNPESFQKLAKRLEELERDLNLPGNRLFYLATPPQVYPQVIEQLGRAGLAKPPNEKAWVRVIIEKPFGHDRESARKLNAKVLSVFEESQVYRIDHYLGKETVQNLLVFRFGNGIFEPLWNRNYISHVEITMVEKLGVENRAAFYETAGALRDMIQSHMMQLVSLVALEPPATFDANAVRNEKIKVLQSIRPFTPETVAKQIVRGQYGPGTIDGKPVPGYRQEKGVRPDSTTETFVAMKLEVDDWRWANVPFYLRTGKRLAEQTTEIAIQFKQAPHLVFRGKNVEPNWLVLNIQPSEGISLSFGAKPPGANLDIRPVRMDFQYREFFGPSSRDAYSALLNDCMRGDATLFDRADSVEAAWALIDPIREAWNAMPPPAFPNYASGSWGPQEALDLLGRDGHKWRVS